MADLEATEIELNFKIEDIESAITTDSLPCQDDREASTHNPPMTEPLTTHVTPSVTPTSSVPTTPPLHNADGSSTTSIGASCSSSFGDSTNSFDSDDLHPVSKQNVSHNGGLGEPLNADVNRSAATISTKSNLIVSLVS